MKSMPQVLKRFQVLFLILVVLSLILILFVPLVMERSNLIEYENGLIRETKIVEAQVETLRKSEVALKSDPLYLEKLARDKLGYSRPGEIIYKFD